MGVVLLVLAAVFCCCCSCCWQCLCCRCVGLAAFVAFFEFFLLVQIPRLLPATRLGFQTSAGSSACRSIRAQPSLAARFLCSSVAKADGRELPKSSTCSN